MFVPTARQDRFFQVLTHMRETCQCSCRQTLALTNRLIVAEVAFELIRRINYCLAKSGKVKGDGQNGTKNWIC